MGMQVGNSNLDSAQLNGASAQGKTAEDGDRLQSVQKLVATGEYRVDSNLVATAILERIGANVAERERVTLSEGGRALLEALTGLRAA